jgi:myo-inositol-1-phosphate synthase
MNMINKIKSGQIRLAIIGMGQILEGVADHMVDHQPRPFLPADLAVPNEDDLVKILKDTRAQILMNYLPVGSQETIEFQSGGGQMVTSQC